jgi:hypothetical protein
MALPLCHHRRRAVQALFGLEHVARGEALVAAQILPQRHEVGRAAHGAQHRVELARPVAVAMREGGHVAAGEGRLLPGDRVERKVWVGDDPRAVLARDGAVHLGAVGLFASTQDPPFLIRSAGAPILSCGSSAMPCASRVR